MLKRIAALLTRKPIEPVLASVESLLPEFPVKRKPQVKKATTRKPAAKKVAAKVATKVAKKTPTKKK